MSAENTANLGFFEAKKSKKERIEQEHAAACAAMMSAISAMNNTVVYNEDDETVDILDNSFGMPLLQRKSLSSAIASKILLEVEVLKRVNPSNTEFLTYVLNETKEYINNPGNKEVQKRYQLMTEKAETKFGRYAGLTTALFGLPLSIFAAGTVGIIFACAAAPVMWPLVAALLITAVVAAVIVSTSPANEAYKVTEAWENIKKTFGR